MNANIPIASDQAGMALWVGERADAGDRIVILDQGARKLPALMVFKTGAEASLKADDELNLKFYEVFSGKAKRKAGKLGRDVPAGGSTRITTGIDVGDLAPGYYLVTADVRRGGKSLLGGRVGSDDLYVKKPAESMTYTALSIRTGMTLWLRDLIFGDIMGETRVALPHTYDPLDKTTYPAFVRIFAPCTGKHTEGNEAGDTGLTLAAEAFRKSGDMARCRFAERLIDDSLRHMIKKMQAPNGGIITVTNELADADLGGGGWGTCRFGSYDSNQVGEWMRALAYPMIYYGRIPARRRQALKLNKACRKAANYLVAHAVQDADGIPNVLRHLTMKEKPDGTVEQVTYYQEGRQCDVYLGRALAGLSYYAYAMQLLGAKVPDKWWEVMDNTVRWSARKMKPNGWFDWQCADIVEGGCHTFLGNIYIGEGMFGVYLASRLAGRAKSAAAALDATRKAYHYVTDDCRVKGVKFEDHAAAPEFWVGPYVYWLFTEYMDTAGPDAKLANWLKMLDRIWTEDHAWRDLLDRPGKPGGYVYRANRNGMLAVAILGWLGIRHMAEIGKPLHWEVTPTTGFPRRVTTSRCAALSGRHGNPINSKFQHPNSKEYLNSKTMK